MEAKVLENLGLTQGEIKTYLALLHLGLTTTGPLSKAAGVSRSKLYEILDKIEKKGLASHVEMNGTLHFQAAEPAKIKDYIDKRKEELQKIANDFEKFLPELEAQRTSNMASVAVYQGLRGLMTAHEHIYTKLERGETFFYLGIPKYQPEAHHIYWQKDHQRRIDAGIKCQLLFNSDTPKETLDNRNKYSGCDARYIPTDLQTPAYFLMYADTVMIAVPSQNPIVIEITSQEVADSFLAYFRAFWKLSKPIEKLKVLRQK